jgi:RNA polymerase sigma factor (sigma-70 family)
MAATAVPFRTRRRPRGGSTRRVGDERLVARVRAGDDDAFEAIYDRYYLGLLAFCRHMLGSRHEAEDALQHSFASAYGALRRGDSAVDLRPWLYTIARNRCLSALRSRRDELEIDGVDVERGSFDGLPVQIQLRAELRELVEDVRRLPDDQRAALVLFELGDQSHDEIAAVLGVRREKIKALVFQARAALLRARNARDASCVEIREQLSSALGAIPRRGVVRAHIDRCEGCAAFEREVRRQRTALAAILPVVPTAGLKASVLGFALGGGGGAAALTSAGVGGGAVAGALGTAGVATVAGGVVTGSTDIVPGLSALGAKGLVTKVLTVVAVAGGTGEAGPAPPQTVAAAPPAATIARAPMVARSTPAATVHRHEATAKPVVYAPPSRPLTGEADAPAQSVPGPEPVQADETPAAAVAPTSQHASVPLAPVPAPTPAPDPEPAPAPAETTQDPAPEPAPSEPTATDAAPTATLPTGGATETATAAPAASTADPDPSATASTLSATDAPPAASAPAAAADDAQN